ncbi:MAG: peptidoglycan-binding protein [Drouetiella hepatica Uher 2000/2452]|jgi:peptidoglycan hydrolase-like protein with peptidoglycan-binding domain|uniref:Peptidoglycan-binding protein n=1 Tax=Drouetiella hepatica Uher 2000/2452 TaxID=904376 RepID=A0A951QD00_9CYAN|nr:peptidoglycan-binding protein [Drouetiella hepatica Uher 2000/2452]
MFTVTQVQAIDPILQIGSQGEKVRQLQALVNPRILVADQVKVDGVFGSKTEAAVKIVQFQFLLEQDGIVGASTWKSLRANAPVGMPILRRGMVSKQVGIVQELLKVGNFYAGAIDNAFGIKTEAAVRAFQKDRQLTADGVIGDRTWKALSNFATFLSID